MSQPAIHGPDQPLLIERGWLSSNHILCAPPNGPAVLFDSGYCTQSDLTVALLRQALGHRPLDRLINTHLHSDHCGGNAALQAAYPGLPTTVPATRLAAVQHWTGEAAAHDELGQACVRFRADAGMAPGDTVAVGPNWCWQAHAAPGHDPDALLFFEPTRRILIAGDALWGDGFGVVFGELHGEDHFSAVGATLDHIESLQPAWVLPGHGAGFGDVPAALARARAKLAFFLREPLRHARHAAKVLVMFKLMETGPQPMDAFRVWLDHNAYLRAIHARFFGQWAPADWIEDILRALGRDPAATQIGP